jgi:hypothetical protein
VVFGGGSALALSAPSKFSVCEREIDVEVAVLSFRWFRIVLFFALLFVMHSWWEKRDGWIESLSHFGEKP